jgi:hypothetical protein
MPTAVKHAEKHSDDTLREHPPEVIALIRWLREPQAARRTREQRRRATASSAAARAPDPDRRVA